MDKLWTAPVALSKLYDVVKNEVVKITIYDELVENVNAIQTTIDLVTKTDYNTKLLKLKEKYLIMIIANMLLHKNLIRWGQIILQWG